MYGRINWFCHELQVCFSTSYNMSNWRNLTIAHIRMVLYPCSPCHSNITVLLKYCFQFVLLITRGRKLETIQIQNCALML